MNEFKLDLKDIQKRAREKMNDGAVTGSYGLDRKQVIDVLNQFLATEIVCTLRYRNNYHVASGIRAEAIADEFLQHAEEEQTHINLICERIAQLGGNPNLNPEGLLQRAHSLYSTSNNLKELISENLVAERVAIESYHEFIRWLGDGDPTTRRLAEEILQQEEEHADDLVGMLDDMR